MAGRTTFGQLRHVIQDDWPAARGRPIREILWNGISSLHESLSRDDRYFATTSSQWILQTVII